MTDNSSQTPTEHPEYSMENDPLFKPLDEKKAAIIDKVVKEQIKSLTMDEVVDVDDTKINGQNYALISIVSPTGTQKADQLCLKIKGVFNQLDEAKKHAEMLQKMDTTFDVYVVEMYSWLLIPPDPELIEQVHVDNKLNEIIGGHRENQLKSKMHFDERKRELIGNIDMENELRKAENEKEKDEQEKAIKEIDSHDPDGILNESHPGTSSAEIGASSNNGENCPNSAPSSTPSELMESMVKETSNNKPSTSWADATEE